MMSGNKCLGCKTCGIISIAVYAVVFLITLYAAYNTHFTSDGTFIAGMTESSLALLTVLFSFSFLVKAFKKACPCGSGCGSGCCGGGCACGKDNCNCGHDGMKK